MKKNLLYNRFVIGSALVIIIGISSCKKNKEETANTSTTSPTSGTPKQLTLDSLFLYAKQIYLWNDAIPDYATFNPRKYSSKSLDLDNYNDELYAISQLKINPLTNQPYEYYGDGFPKYSFIDDLTQANPSASANLKSADVDTEGNGNDVGIRPIYYLEGSTSGAYILFITAVYPGSPAAAAGVQRGWVITSVNGTAVVGKDYDTEHAAIDAAIAGNSVTISGYNYVDNVPFTKTLAKASYKSSPVYASSVITRSGTKIGYLAFARFSALTNSDAPSDVNLDPVFSNFSGQGITDLVVDLRYNGGGYINTAEYLADLIAPSSVAGKKMYSEIYNATMQAGKATILANQPALGSDGKVQYKNGSSGAIYTLADESYATTDPSNNASFTKKGSLNTITNVVFIVSGNTASAAELLINVLRPYVNVQIVGSTTYGKPVGFFPIVLQNRYQVYMSLFQTENANGFGGYYSGFVPAGTGTFGIPGIAMDDDPTYPFGDEREADLSASLNLLVPGSTSNQATVGVVNRAARPKALTIGGVRAANPRSEFTGMIANKRTIKK
ncbi:S41 family peptidase [Pedobacter sp. L105]|uniref:S41 family peptidase n=1 Tax=Pedobacter sp. L105 TaxID=1641871 RepID=UPI00131AB82A|nr:S41 family peptidase [Pedobacter sp. L105]